VLEVLETPEKAIEPGQRSTLKANFSLADCDYQALAMEKR
jgi:hypothetical protein